ncbi:MAG: L-dopachrome tautomerase-related protein [Planctomycetota bacterium]
MPQIARSVLIAAAALLAAGCATSNRAGSTGEPFEVVAESARYRWTGVAAVIDGRRERIFVNYPHWNERAPAQVAELIDGQPVAYPNATMQSWSPGQNPASRWVCVQSVHADDSGRLWVLDPAAPGFQGPVPGGAKLVHIDPDTDRIVRTYLFDDTAAPPGTYLNDVRIDLETDTAFITDSGRGGLVILDLATGATRRVLDRHPLTETEPGVTLTVGGQPFLAPDGTTPQIHSDGIAIDPETRTLYFQAITARTLHSIPLDTLLDASLGDAAIARAASSHANAPVTDGMLFHKNRLHFSALEEDGVVTWDLTGSTPRRDATVSHPRIAWPDSFAKGKRGSVLVTTAQIHSVPPFEPGARVPEQPYLILRVRP